MTGLEVALIILVTIWSMIFIVIGIAILMIFLGVKRAVNKANQILDRTEEVANKVDLPSKVVIASIVAFMAKSSFRNVKDIIGAFVKNKNTDKS